MNANPPTPKQESGCLPEGYDMNSMLTPEQFCKWQQRSKGWFYRNQHSIKGRSMGRIHPATFLKDSR